jgi:tetratricopeptide (TPR) repeat protein
MSDQRAVRQALRKLMSAPKSAARVIAFLEHYVRSNPDDHETVLWYADSLRIVGRCREAVELLKPTFERTTQPGNRSAMAARIAMALEPTNPQQAEEWFSKAIEIDADVPGWISVLRGANLARMERFDAAIESYHLALHGKDVDADEVYLNMGRAYRAKEDYESALEYLRRSQTLRGGDEIDAEIADLEDVARARQLAESLKIGSSETPLH